MSVHMRAVWYEGAGGVEVIKLRDVPRPVPGPHEVRVRVHCAGLNRADLLQRRGLYPAPPGWPSQIPGLEFSGVIDAVGAAAMHWRIGDRVMGLVGGGAQAESLVIREDELMPVPPLLSDAEAAAIPEAFLTAWDALKHRARLEPGQRVLVHAAGSGVGTAAVQLAKAMHLTVAGTSRTASKLDRLVALGLDEPINTSNGSFRNHLEEPVHAVIDSLGGPAFADNLAVLHPRGRLVMIGHLQGSRTEADLGLILRQRLEVIGTTMRARGPAERSSLVRGFIEEMLPSFSLPGRPGDPQLVPVVDEVIPMEEVARAHQRMESNETFGKLVLTW
jgi:putative PIG3 family NAD(P)H quinone oxidoreductase